MEVFSYYRWVKVVMVGGCLVAAEGERMVTEARLPTRTMKRQGGCFRVCVLSRDARRCRFPDGPHSGQANEPVRDRG